MLAGTLWCYCTADWGASARATRIPHPEANAIGILSVTVGQSLSEAASVSYSTLSDCQYEKLYVCNASTTDFEVSSTLDWTATSYLVRPQGSEVLLPALGPEKKTIQDCWITQLRGCSSSLWIRTLSEIDE